jgi:hypothetical protein
MVKTAMINIFSRKLFVIAVLLFFPLLQTSTALAYWQFDSSTKIGFSTWGQNIKVTIDVCSGSIVSSVTQNPSCMKDRWELRFVDTETGSLKTYEYLSCQVPTIEFTNGDNCACPSPQTWNSQTNSCDEPEPDCPDGRTYEQAYTDQQEICGGPYVSVLNEENCEFICNCNDDPARKTYEEYIALCGGVKYIASYDQNLCIGECQGEPCQAQLNEKIEECGGLQHVSATAVYEEDCDYLECIPCSKEREEANASCENGFEFNDTTCEYNCHNCENIYSRAVTECGGSANIEYFDCRESLAGQVVDYRCKQQEPNTPPDPIDDPNSDIPPDAEPEPEPTDTDQQRTEKYLEAVNDNVKNTNRNLENIGNKLQNTNNYLDSISNNTKKGVTADNQKIAELKKINEGLQDLNNRPDESYNGQTPDVPEFNSDLPETEEYYNDAYNSVDLATGKATDDFTELDTSNIESPYQGALTVADINTCIDGTITLKGNPKPVQVCFNKPWMERGYAIMKLILIALGYIQTAMLINRGLGG